MREKKRLLNLTAEEMRMLLNTLGNAEFRALEIDEAKRRLLLSREEYVALLYRITDERNRKLGRGESYDAEASFLIKLMTTKERRVKER